MNGEVMVTCDRSGQDKLRVGVEALGDAEDVVPPAGVESANVGPQFMKNLVHLEGRGDGLDEHGGPDRTRWKLQGLIGRVHDVTPQARLHVMPQVFTQFAPVVEPQNQ